MTPAEQKLVTALAAALEPTPMELPSSTAFFHGTGLQKPGVQVDPPRLSGDKWFSQSKEYTAYYGKPVWHGQQQGAIFQIVLRPQLFVAKERGPGAWAKALKYGFLDLRLGESPQDLERRYIRGALNALFKAHPCVVGLYKPPSPSSANDELFLLNCEVHISQIVIAG